MKWQLDFMGPMKLTWRYIMNKYSFITTDSDTQWVEARPLRINTIEVTIKFLYECIFTKFGCPLIIVTNQGVHFINDAIKYLIYHFLMKHVSSTTYYPQGNGQAESTNNVLRILSSKLVSENRIDWDEHLSTMLFAYKTSYKIAIGYTPYQLVYGLHPLMPTKYIIPIASGDERIVFQ